MAEEIFFSCDLNDDNVSAHLIACCSSFHKAGPATENARLSYVSNLVLSTVNNAWEAERRVRDGWWLRSRADRYWGVIPRMERYVSTKSLKIIRVCIGNQWSSFKTGVVESLFSGWCDNSCSRMLNHLLHLNVGPTSKTVCQHYPNIESMFYV